MKTTKPRKFIGGQARAQLARPATNRLLMGDRLIVDGKYCGNKLDSVPRDVLQAIVEKSDGSKTDRDRIRLYLFMLIRGRTRPIRSRHNQATRLAA